MSINKHDFEVRMYEFDGKSGEYEAYLPGDGYVCSFYASIYNGVADVTVAVAKDEWSLNQVIGDMSDGVFDVTGIGSIKPLLHIKDHMMGPFKELCEMLGVHAISILPADYRRGRAYRYLCRYGFFVVREDFLSSQLVLPLDKEGVLWFNERKKMYAAIRPMSRVTREVVIS